MLTLPIKKKWYDMILNGIKKEEYREIKPYYTTRFTNAGLLKQDFKDDFDKDGNPAHTSTGKSIQVLFRNGYSSTSPTIGATVHLEIKVGNPDWGAEPGKLYYCLCIE